LPPTFEISNALLARGEGPSAPTRQTPVPHTSATHPLEGASARVLRSLKPTTPDIDKIYALATTSVGVPSWAALMTADPGATRDDDLSTGWSCTLAQGKPCALIATFDKPVQLRAIRLFSGLIGHKSQSIQTLRVHTDAGVAEVSNLSVGKHRHIYLDKPVTTRQLVLEVVKTAGRPKTLPVALAELEIYGESGLARAPLNLDPSLAHLRFDASPWEASEGGEGPWKLNRDTCIHTIGSDGLARCFLRGTALLGEAGDRTLLAEVAYKTSCEQTEGVYILIDQTTRRFINVGALGGFPAPIYSRRDGLGFAGIKPEEDGVADDLRGYVGVSLAPDGRVARERVSDRFALVGRGFAARGLARGGGIVAAPSSGCQSPSLAEYREVVGRIAGEGHTELREELLEDYEDDEVDPQIVTLDDWSMCTLKDGPALLFDDTDRVYWIAKEGAVASLEIPAHEWMFDPRIRVSSQAGSWWIERVGPEGERSSLVRIGSGTGTGTGGTFQTLLVGASFSAGPPIACDEPFAEVGSSRATPSLTMEGLDALSTLATLRPAARTALAEVARVEDIGEVTLGDMNRDGRKDAIVRVPIDDPVGMLDGMNDYWLLLSGPRGVYETESIRSLYGLAHTVTFDVLRSGKRAVLVHDTKNCCQKGITVFSLDEGTLDEVMRGEAGESEDLIIDRDAKGRLKKIRVVRE